MNHKILALVMMGILTMATPVFAQQGGPANPNANVTSAYNLLHSNSTTSTNNPVLTVRTDLPSYNQGDTIVITGHVNQPDSSTAVTLRVFNTDQNLISLKQLPPSSDGSFTTTFLITGPLWQKAGTYTVLAQYGKYTQTTTTFYFNGGTGTTTITQATNVTYSLQSGGQTYNIPYIMIGGTVKSMDIYANKFALEITTDAKSDGSITITLPRPLIDAKQGGKDIKFIIMVNNNPVVQFGETQNQNVRVLSIPFHAGDTKIDIMGTQTVGNSTPIPLLPPVPSKIPSWVRHIFIYYGQGQVSEDELLGALKFLIQQGILKVQ